MKRRIIRKPEVLACVGLSDTTVWRLEKSGKFPRRVKLGGNSVGWFEDEIDALLEQKSGERFPEAAR